MIPINFERFRLENPNLLRKLSLLMKNRVLENLSHSILYKDFLTDTKQPSKEKL